MSAWDQIRKLDPMPPIEAGISAVTRLIARDAGAGVAIGFSDIAAGAMDVDVGDPELFVVIDGALRIVARDAVETVAAGEGIWFPANCRVRVEADAPCRAVYAIFQRAH